MDLSEAKEERYYLLKLSRYLNYGMSGSLLYILSFFWSIVIIAAIIASLVFVTLMLYIFIKLRKIAWLVSFLIIVIIPSTAFLILGYSLGYLSIFLLIPLAFFYFYCFILKNMINDRLEEVFALERRLLEKEEETGTKPYGNDIS